MAEAEESVPEMVGATEEPVRLTTKPTTAEVAVSAPTGPALKSLAAHAEPRRVIVILENVTGAGVAMNYEVFVNGKPAGVLPMFGVREATRATDRHANDGLEFRYDVTDIVRETGADPKNLKVTFVPEIDEEEVAQAAGLRHKTAGEPEFRVGRVSVYLA